jgi:chemotaxis protein histidine kinase CheA
VNELAETEVTISDGLSGGEPTRLGTDDGRGEVLDLVQLVQELTALARGIGQDNTMVPDGYAEQLTQIAEVSANTGYPGLSIACRLYTEGLARLGAEQSELTQEQRAIVQDWPRLLHAYLNAPTDPVIGHTLITILRSSDIASTLSDEDAQSLTDLVTEPSLEGVTERESMAALTPQDTAEDTSTRDPSPHAGSVALPFAEGPPVAVAQADSMFPAPCVPSEGQAIDPLTTAECAGLAGLPAGTRELVELLIEELALMEEPQTQALELALAPDADPEARQHALMLYAEHLERYGEAAGAVGLQGLHQVCMHAQGNVLALGAEQRVVQPSEAEALAQWTGRVRDYLSKGCSPDVAQALVEALSGTGWRCPLTPDAAAPLLGLLQTPDLAQADEDSVIARPQQACPEDVSLALPEDVNRELLEAMLQELPGQVQELSSTIQNLGVGGTLHDVQAAQRIAHTVKGAGNTVGVRGLASLTHHLEDILLELAKHETLPAQPLAASMLSAADCLEAMCEALTGAVNPPEDACAVLQDILDWANRIDQQGLPAHEKDLPAADPMPDHVPERVLEVADATLSEPIDREEQPAAPAGHMAPMTRVPVSLLDNLLRLAGETLILTGQVHERLRATAHQTQSMQTQFTRLRHLGMELERFIDITDLHANVHPRVAQLNFDPLEMDQYSELHTYSRMLVETAMDARAMGNALADNLADLNDMLVGQQRLNRETQDTLLHARMVPVKTVLPRLQRALRQTCRLTGKQAELHPNGVETLMDSDVLNGLVDPLMHLLRNAVDHGIEAPETRVAVGKKPTGIVQLDFVREGNNVVVRCSDDGAGLNWEAIRQRGKEAGLLSGDRDCTDEELKRLILRPSFSTRSETTQTSGRGIGMDVVYGRILDLRGSLGIDSEAGQGCVVELRLPLTLITTHALLVQTGDHTLAVADRGVEQILHGEDGALRLYGDQRIFQVNEAIYPVKTLAAMLGLNEGSELDPESRRPLFLVRGDMEVHAVLVGQVLESRDLVVKALGAYVPKLPGIMGVTILGDGAVAPVIDLPELLRAGDRVRVTSESSDQPPQRLQYLPLALVVDDSLSARRALIQLMEDSGYEVSAARDGAEAVQLIEHKRPDIVLADMEMPRMNGIELISHLRAQEETRDLPVIMITSRSTRKHQEQAKAAGVNVYLTKPFSEDELLGYVESLRRP